MDFRRFLLTSLAGVLAAPLAAEGQQTGKVWRIADQVIEQRLVELDARDRRLRAVPRRSGSCGTTPELRLCGRPPGK